VQDVDAPPPQHPRERDGGAEVSRSPETKGGERDVGGEIRPQRLRDLRSTHQVGPEDRAVEAAQERQDVLLHATADNGIGEMQDGERVHAGTASRRCT
jgi:hypothetical protein